MKIEMHLHSADSNDHFANIPAAELVSLYHERGYDGIVLTEHFSAEARSWLRDEICGFSHSQIIDRWMKSYRMAKAVGDKIGCAVFLGMELRLPGSANDYLIYGLDEYFLKNNPPLDSLSLDEINQIKTDDILIYQAHPFREHMMIVNPGKLFGIESYNGHASAQCNHIAEEWANTFGLHRISGSDCHRIYQLGKGGLDFHEEIHSTGELINALKQDRYDLIKA